MHSILFKKGENGTVYDSYTQWGIVCKDFPFKILGDAKELESNNWKDEDGKDTYFPNKLFIEAYSIDVEFAAKGFSNDSVTINEKVSNFVKYLTGRGSSQGTSLSVYDQYTRIGRQGVYFSKISNDVYVKQIVNGTSTEEVCEFKITFNVCDPVTDVSLQITN